MFSGIIEAQGIILEAKPEPGIVRICLEKPSEFSDLSIGDSIATNGVCLTIEAFDDLTITFALGAETLHVTGWSAQGLVGQKMNLERSLRFGDRIHGHLVSGHVDATADVLRAASSGEVFFLDVRIPKPLRAYVWKKGSWTVNGVSLTVNDVNVDGVASACLIPETLKRTNLGSLRVGDRVNLEVDWMARGLLRALELGLQPRLGDERSGEERT